MRTFLNRPGCWLLALGLLLALPRGSAAQAFSSGSTGADGPFNPTSNMTLTLPPNGVFNFTTINIPSGVTVRFLRNAANTPVILLATGNVVLNGLLDVSGSTAGQYGRPGAGGPGGYDGGIGADGITTATGSVGLGPGGGGGGPAGNGSGGGGSYATAGAAGGGGGGATYGGVTLRPIVGGSGGGGGGGALGSTIGGGGGGGGGAILIASSTSITIHSVDYYNRAQTVIQANGGNGTAGVPGMSAGAGGAGSGGAIRLIAPTITGTSVLDARGGSSYDIGAGRVRLEASNLAFTGSSNPLAATGYLQPVFPAAGQPRLAIASAAGIAAPEAPRGTFLDPPDILLPAGTTNPIEVVLTAGNMPLGTVIQVMAAPQSGGRVTATSTGLAGSVASSTATASLSLNLSQTSILTATATYALVAGAGEGPLYAEGEEVTHVTVAAVFGGASTVTYLTRSGREVQVQ